MERLERLKLLLGIEGAERDELLRLSLEAAESQVLTYIRQETLPAALETALVMIAAGLWKAGGFGEEKATGALSSVSRGDVTTSFFAPKADGLATDADGFFGWRAALNTYRRLRW